MAKSVDLLKQFLLDEYSLSIGENDFIFSKFKHFQAKKNLRLLDYGAVCKYAYFICEGCLRTYFLDEKGEEKTRYIAFEKSFVGAFASFITQTPSAECVQALEHSELLRIKQIDFYELVDTHPTFAKLYRQSLEQAHVFATWRIEPANNVHCQSQGWTLE